MDIASTDTGALAELASLLACNHACLTTAGQGSIRGQDLLTEATRAWSRERQQVPGSVIAVVGAGASVDRGLPLGDKAIRLLRSKLRVPEALYAQEMERLTGVYRLDRADLETQLLALSRFDHQQELVRELHRIYARRHFPSHTYEILAHLLKHRFLDAIVNLNFDELLDQSIEDELGEGRYRRIVFDGDCPEDLDRVRDALSRRFDLPLYIKPHGTASHKSTMRFTRGAYFRLPDDIARLLFSLFSELPTHLVAIGYDMRSFELNRTFINARRHYLKLDPAEEPGKVAAKDEQSSAFAINIRVPGGFARDDLAPYLDRGGLIRVEKTQTALGQCLSDLWRAVETRLEGPVRGIRRHRLISDVFGRTAASHPPENWQRQQYFRDRLLVELALAVAKSKGFVTLSQLMAGRVGRYFLLYRERSDPANRESLYDICRSLGLGRSSYSRETLRLGGPPAGDDGPLTVPAPEYGAMVRTVIELMSPEGQSLIAGHEEDFRGALREMHGGAEVEVSPDDPGSHFELFANPMVLNSLTSLRLHTRRLLAKRWTLMLAVAESGNWLLDPETAATIREGRIVKLIVADPVDTEAVVRRFDGLVEVLRMPWWLHNQHMTIVADDRGPRAGIYFERRLRDSFITPLVLEGCDARSMVDVFVAYLVKAYRFSRDKPKRIISEDDVFRVRQKLLADPSLSVDEIMGLTGPD